MAWAIWQIFPDEEYGDNQPMFVGPRNRTMQCDAMLSPVLVRSFPNLRARSLLVLSCVVGILLCSQALAATENVVSLLSPRVAGMSLPELQKRLGAMECAIGSAGAKDCFIAMPFGAASRVGGNEEARVFLRARGGRVGQIIINGPAGQLTNVLAVLSLHYGASSAGVSRVSSSTPAPCTELSQWQREGQSVLVKVCRNPLGNGGGQFGGGEFVVNILADWYALSR